MLEKAAAGIAHSTHRHHDMVQHTGINRRRRTNVSSCLVFLVVSFSLQSLPSIVCEQSVVAPSDQFSKHKIDVRNGEATWSIKAGKHHQKWRHSASFRNSHSVSATNSSRNSVKERDCDCERLSVPSRPRRHRDVRRRDVIDVYEYDDVPGIWENHIPRDGGKRSQQGDGEDSDPVWRRLPSPEQISRFKDLVQTAVRCRRLPAMTLTLVKQGRVLLTANLGLADSERHVPVSRSTRFAIGSLTKAFTATVVAEILMRYNISLDTPIDQLLPDGFVLVDEVRTRSITVRDLLGHRTGVPGYFYALLMGFPVHVTRHQLVSRLRYLPAVAPLRSEFLYNNYLYTLAAYVVEKMTGRSWEALLQDMILGPLGMKSTGFVDQVSDFSQFALPCALVNGSIRNLAPELLYTVAPCGPAGSLYSTAHDMARWLLVLLSNGKDPEGRQLLQERALRETTRAVMPPPGIGTDLTKPEYPISDVEQSYGMGWITSNYRGYQKVWHSGGIVTYSSRLWLLPAVEAGLFIATSGPQTADKRHALTAIASAAADLLLGERYWLNSSTVCTFPAPWKRPGTSSAADTVTSSTTSLPSLSLNNRGNQVSSHISAAARRRPTMADTVDQLLGSYYHKAFGEILIARAGNDSVHNIIGNKLTKTKAPISESYTTGNANTSNSLLQLSFGRFGLMKLKQQGGKNSDQWEARFVGPLWYVTASDEATDPVRVTFLRDEKGHVDRLRYPLDENYDVIEFWKRSGDDMPLQSCCGSRFESLVEKMIVIFIFQAYTLTKLFWE